MTASIISSIITGLLALLGVIVTNRSNSDKMQAKLEARLTTAQAVTDTKLDELTREVREHNNFARRMPVVEAEINNIKNQLEKLEKGA